jgi:N-acetyl-alpha-D-glucosaminyl L-malate synthase BshA
MNIGMVCYASVGGSGVVGTELAHALALRGHRVHLISSEVPFRWRHGLPGLSFERVETPAYPLFREPQYLLALANTIVRVACERKLDLVHAHYAVPHATAAYLADQILASGRDASPAQTVTTLHGTDITLLGQHPSFHAITRFSILQSDGLSAVSQFLKDETVQRFAVPADRIDVIPNFVDTGVWRRDREPCHRSKLAGADQKIVMHVSNFREVKRVGDVVEVFAKIRRSLDARLVLVGDGPERPRALQQAADLGLGEDVLFLGRHASVEDLLACADLFLLPSASESFGLAALEAMACGTPVIASNAGGLREVVEDGVSGYLLPVGATDAMAEAGARILKDDALRRKMRAAARRIAVERFSADAIVPQY